MPASKKFLAGNANIARAMTGAFAVVIGGATIGASPYGDCLKSNSNSNSHQDSAEEGEPIPTEDRIIRQQSEKTSPLNALRRRILPPPPSSSTWSSPIWSMVQNGNCNCNYHGNTVVSACEGKRRNIDPSFPDLSRFGSASYLRRYLTPEVYASLKDRKTKNGVTLEDIIRSGISLPWGAKPPRGTGVYAGDEESYHVFAELLVPIIEDYHRYHLVEKKMQHQSPLGPSNDNCGATSSNDGNNYDNNNLGSTSSTAAVAAMSPAMILEVGPMHGRKNSKKSGIMLRRQFTNLNRNSVLEQKLDPTGDYILETRMRVARSIKGFPFSPVISRAQRRELEELFQRMVDEDWNNDSDDHNTADGNDSDDHNNNNDEFGFGKIINNHGGLRDGKYLSVMDMTNEQHDELISRHILFHDPDEYNISAGIGRDWPDARGIYLNSSSTTTSDRGRANGNANTNPHENPDLMIWLNKEDHMRIIATSDGGDLLAVFARLSKTLTQVEQSLHKRGHAFAKHHRYGFVNTSPENLGTALRASVYIKLYRLGQQPGFEAMLDRLRLETSSRFKSDEGSGARYTGIFDIANAERLGQSEVQLINAMINGVGRLIELEKRLEDGENVDLEEVR